jgi:hypothetical protein
MAVVCVQWSQVTLPSGVTGVMFARPQCRQFHFRMFLSFTYDLVSCIG